MALLDPSVHLDPLARLDPLVRLVPLVHQVPLARQVPLVHQVPLALQGSCPGQGASWGHHLLPEAFQGLLRPWSLDSSKGVRRQRGFQRTPSRWVQELRLDPSWVLLLVDPY